MKLNLMQKRVKIAEACGWKKCHAPGAIGLLIGIAPESYAAKHNETPYQISGKGPWHEIPDYFNDLNACHDIKKTLTKEQCPVFHDYLMDAEKPSLHTCINSEHSWSERWSWGQPPGTEAECLGLALNLWTPDQ